MARDTTPTDYRAYERPERGANWHTAWDDLVGKLDIDPVRQGQLADRPASAPDGAWYFARDEGIIYQYTDANGWVAIGGAGTSSSLLPNQYVSNLVVGSIDGNSQSIPVEGLFDLSDTGSDPATNGEVSHNAGDIKVHSGGQVRNLSNILSPVRLIEGPNLPVPEQSLSSGETWTHSVPVPDGQTATVYLWGAYTSSGTVPTGLSVRFLDPSGTAIQTEETARTANEAGIASHSNSSGGLQFVELVINNGTGNPHTVGGQFGYEVK